MDIKKYGTHIATAVAAATVTAIVTYALTREEIEIKPPPKYRRVDISSFKRSMNERYKHAELIKLEEPFKTALIQAIHTNIDKDIHALFTDVEHAALLSYNDELLAKYS